MNLKNANIQSKEEFIDRLFKKREIFYTEVHGYLEKIYYEHDKSGNPFVREQVGKMLQGKGNRIPIYNTLDSYREMSIEIPHTWEDDLIHGPILCKVWNYGDRQHFASISTFNSIGYTEENTLTRWKYATPVTPNMLYNPEDFT